ncbi:hypothetical protein FEM48_Zijuj07G0060800 [Ziziphus jujuba var. spinosa]|uniref:Secreted protein n=1 Tax=Ziziphus jujuba var. spinosa TaxID=714518 RepID=A0A978V2W9_ZIZJJ|nr:hypothetical protein FEM48_Zijuj07G0060800 [Ziziphus jujuba var. spinosa]
MRSLPTSIIIMRRRPFAFFLLIALALACESRTSRRYNLTALAANGFASGLPPCSSKAAQRRPMRASRLPQAWRRGQGQGAAAELTCWTVPAKPQATAVSLLLQRSSRAGIPQTKVYTKSVPVTTFLVLVPAHRRGLHQKCSSHFVFGSRTGTNVVPITLFLVLVPAQRRGLRQKCSSHVASGSRSGWNTSLLVLVAAQRRRLHQKCSSQFASGSRSGSASRFTPKVFHSLRFWFSYRLASGSRSGSASRFTPKVFQSFRFCQRCSSHFVSGSRTGSASRFTPKVFQSRRFWFP